MHYLCVVAPRFGVGARTAHAKRNNGEGFCFLADIPLAILKIRIKNPNLKILIIDLDAHQGNGLADILGSDPLTVIFDMYSDYNYPRDIKMREYIDFNYPLKDFINTSEYLNILKNALPKKMVKKFLKSILLI